MVTLLRSIKDQARHQSDLVMCAWTGGFMLPPIAVTIFRHASPDASYWDRLQLTLGMILLVGVMYVWAVRIMAQLHAKAQLLAIIAVTLPVLLWIVVLAKLTPLMLTIAPITMLSLFGCAWLTRRRVYHYELNRLANDAVAYRAMSA
jgi:drug/metabolite transporter (DMT)-like permease